MRLQIEFSFFIIDYSSINHNTLSQSILEIRFEESCRVSLVHNHKQQLWLFFRNTYDLCNSCFDLSNLNCPNCVELTYRNSIPVNNNSFGKNVGEVFKSLQSFHKNLLQMLRSDILSLRKLYYFSKMSRLILIQSCNHSIK